VASALAGDALLGRISGSSEIRAAARQFREEAAYLEMPTKNLIPNIEHVYREWDNGILPKVPTNNRLRNSANSKQIPMVLSSIHLTRLTTR
jgi:hypothetical protein